MFGFRAHAAILVTRMVILPWIGRVIFRIFAMKELPSKLLGVFSLIELSVPTANATVMIIVIVSKFLPNIGLVLEEELASSVFYQFCVVPIFFSINTVFTLNLVFDKD